MKINYELFKAKCQEWKQMCGYFHRLIDMAEFFGNAGIAARAKQVQDSLVRHESEFKSNYALLARELDDYVGCHFGRAIQILLPLPHFYGL